MALFHSDGKKEKTQGMMVIMNGHAIPARAVPRRSRVCSTYSGATIAADPFG